MKKKHTKQTQKPVAKAAPEPAEVKQLGRVIKADVKIDGNNATGLSLILGSTDWEVTAYRPISDLASLLSSAKVTGLNTLVGAPVEVTSIGNKMKSWRILEEVL